MYIYIIDRYRKRNKHDLDIFRQNVWKDSMGRSWSISLDRCGACHQLQQDPRWRSLAPTRQSRLPEVLPGGWQSERFRGCLAKKATHATDHRFYQPFRVPNVPTPCHQSYLYNLIQPSISSKSIYTGHMWTTRSLGIIQRGKPKVLGQDDSGDFSAVSCYEHGLLATLVQRFKVILGHFHLRQVQEYPSRFPDTSQSCGELNSFQPESANLTQTNCQELMTYEHWPCCFAHLNGLFLGFRPGLAGSKIFKNDGESCWWQGFSNHW